MNEILRQWERDYGDKRHESNTKKFEEIFAVLNKVRGFTVGFGCLLTILKVLDMLGFHK